MIFAICLCYFDFRAIDSYALCFVTPCYCRRHDTPTLSYAYYAAAGAYYAIALMPPSYADTDAATMPPLARCRRAATIAAREARVLALCLLAAHGAR